MQQPWEDTRDLWEDYLDQLEALVDHGIDPGGTLYVRPYPSELDMGFPFGAEFHQVMSAVLDVINLVAAPIVLIQLIRSYARTRSQRKFILRIKKGEQSMEIHGSMSTRKINRLLNEFVNLTKGSWKPIEVEKIDKPRRFRQPKKTN